MRKIDLWSFFTSETSEENTQINFLGQNFIVECNFFFLHNWEKTKDLARLFLHCIGNNYLFFSWKIRKTKKVSVFPVGLLSGRPVSTPVVKNGEIVDFYEGWIGGREFPIDMAGFAFTVKVLKEVKKSNNLFEIIWNYLLLIKYLQF